jgi:RimJ/RimL family protein N-acetyltransferase
MNPECLDRAAGVELLDGSVISIRRLDEGDIRAIVRLHKHLSDLERYMRFFVVHPAFLKALAESLTERDKGHCGLGAFDSGRLIGVANYVVSNNPEVAEVAVAVAHGHHLRGVATALLQQLAKIALRNGIRTFTADVLAGNTAMLRVLSDAGWQHTTRLEDSVLNIQIDLSQFAAPTQGDSAAVS